MSIKTFLYTSRLLILASDHNRKYHEISVAWSFVGCFRTVVYFITYTHLAFRLHLFIYRFQRRPFLLVILYFYFSYRCDTLKNDSCSSFDWDLLKQVLRIYFSNLLQLFILFALAE